MGPAWLSHSALTCSSPIVRTFGRSDAALLRPSGCLPMLSRLDPFWELDSSRVMLHMPSPPNKSPGEPEPDG
jgi:hypothetical protein